jgi:asparagine synthase (glutamine-hydrolysing)
MSGLAGIVCSRGCSEEGHTRLLEKMCEAQAHRGPDDRRVVSLERVALAATHLRMIDLSAAVSQPMQDEDGSVWIVFDGALYNYRELRDELAERGHRFRTESDTEVVLHAYREWGEACLDHFIGIFAFAIHERRKGTTTLVRDHFGVKPLYYAIRDQHLFFASEIKALIAVDSPQRLNERALVEWSLYRHVMPPETLFEGITADATTTRATTWIRSSTPITPRSRPPTWSRRWIPQFRPASPRLWSGRYRSVSC